MIVMSLDANKDHVFKKIMNNLNWLKTTITSDHLKMHEVTFSSTSLM